MAAIIIPSRQQHARNKKEDHEKILKAKCLATAVRFNIHDVQTFLANAKVIARRQSSQTEMLNVLPEEYQFFRVEIPPILGGDVDRVYLLHEPTGPLLLRLNAVLNNYNKEVTLQFQQSFTDPSFPVSQRWERLVSFIEDVEPLLKETLIQVSKIADSK